MSSSTVLIVSSLWCKEPVVKGFATSWNVSMVSCCFLTLACSRGDYHPKLTIQQIGNRTFRETCCCNHVDLTGLLAYRLDPRAHEVSKMSNSG